MYAEQVTDVGVAADDIQLATVHSEAGNSMETADEEMEKKVVDELEGREADNLAAEEANGTMLTRTRQDTPGGSSMNVVVCNLEATGCIVIYSSTGGLPQHNSFAAWLFMRTHKMRKS